MLQLDAQDRAWVSETWGKVERKIRVTALQVGGNFPYTTTNGKYESFARFDDIAMWTNGFWPCMMLQMYNATRDNVFLEIARDCEEKLDAALYDYDKLIHDVGFMWDISAFADYRLTGDYRARQRGLNAAAVLTSRFHLRGSFIRAWNMPEAAGWAIIDCMMNLPLLYRASEAVGDDRFTQIAQTHADMTMNYFVRPDGSCDHVIELDLETGLPKGKPHTQGYGPDSSWARGQAWGIYGFVLSYLFTGKTEYLNTAKRIAHYFLACMADEQIPDVDFRAPQQPVKKDSTAGACAACGLIEIARCVPEYEQPLYLKGAIRLLRGLTSACCDFSEKEMSIMQMGSEAYHSADGIHIPIIYGDSFYMEALQKLLGNEFLIW